MKPNADKIIDFAVGSGLEIDPMKSTVMPRNKLLRSNDMRLAVMPNENTGLGLKKKKARFVKGSIEAKQFMASIRKGKGAKCGGNVFDDLGKKLKETFTPDLGRKIKDTLTSDTAKKIYKGVADTVIPIIATSTGNPMLGKIAQIGVDSALGSGIKKKHKSTNIKSLASFEPFTNLAFFFFKPKPVFSLGITANLISLGRKSLFLGITADFIGSISNPDPATKSIILSAFGFKSESVKFLVFVASPILSIRIGAIVFDAPFNKSLNRPLPSRNVSFENLIPFL